LFSRVDKSKYSLQFEELGPVDGKLTGAVVRDELLGSKVTIQRPHALTPFSSLIAFMLIFCLSIRTFDSYRQRFWPGSGS
jgi:hypothetical protein